MNYDDLPSYALAIALFDAREGEKGRYMSHKYISDILDGSGIAVVPTVDITKPILTSADCLSQIKRSYFSSESKMEGLILRVDEGDYNVDIMKFVSPHFKRSVDESEHWTKTELRRNKINYTKQAELLSL